MLIRFFLYGVLGWCVEIVWTALTHPVASPRERWRLQGTTYLWMLPIYGLIAPVYEPMHDLLRPWPWALRAPVYAVGFMSLEYATGWLLRRLIGVCPWDYTDRAHWHIQGLVRLEYAPLWAGLGLLLEPVHDFLLRLTLVLQQLI
ncbi:MAG: hypothetical protein HY703_06575 [Gemmatimonadetes bacterium]|nr:hypothetical protein [Gemmatimonadota bacterium]